MKDSKSDKDEDRDPADEPSWRKCLVCGVRVYEAKGKKKEDTAPENAWVTVDFSSGVLVSHRDLPQQLPELRLHCKLTRPVRRSPRQGT